MIRFPYVHMLPFVLDQSFQWMIWWVLNEFYWIQLIQLNHHVRMWKTWPSLWWTRPCPWLICQPPTPVRDQYFDPILGYELPDMEMLFWIQLKNWDIWLYSTIESVTSFMMNLPVSLIITSTSYLLMTLWILERHTVNQFLKKWVKDLSTNNQSQI